MANVGSVTGLQFEDEEPSAPRRPARRDAALDLQFLDEPPPSALADTKRHPFRAGFEQAKSALGDSLPKAIEKAGVFGLELTPEEESVYAARERASAARADELLPGGAAGLSDIKERGISAIPQVIGENLAVSAPQIGAALTGTAAAVAAAPATLPAAAVGGLALAGGAVASTPFFAGSNSARASEGGQRPLSETGAERSLLVAPVQATGEALLGKFVPGVGKYLPGANITGGLGTRVVKGTVGGALQGGATEAAQQGGERYAAELPLGDKSARDEYTESALIGGLTEGAVGGAGAPFRNDARTAKPSIDPDEGVRSLSDVGTAEPTNVLTDRATVRRNATSPGAQQEMFTRDQEGPVTNGLSTRDVLTRGIRPTETGSNPAQISEAGAVGANQLLPSTARAMADRLGIPFSMDRLLNDPDYNTELANEYLNTLVSKYDGDMLKAVTAYHAGPGNVDSWISRFGDPSEIGAAAWLDQIEKVGNPRSAAYPRTVLKNLGSTDFGDGRIGSVRSDILGETQAPQFVDFGQQAELDLEPTGTQQDLFGAGRTESKVDTADQAQLDAVDTQTGDLFDRAPEAEAMARAAADFRMTTVLREIRSAFANPDGTVPPPNPYSVKLATELSTALTRGDRAAATKLIEDETTKLQNASLKSDTIDLRQRALDAAQQVVGRFNSAVTNQFAEAARTRQAQGATQSANVGVMGGDRLPTPTVENQTSATSDTTRIDPENVSEVAANSIRKQADAQRQSVLDFVLSDPETRNPTRRFLNELKKRGSKSGGLSEEEVERIAKFEEVRDAFAKPDEVPSAPDESDNFGIRERGAPRVSERQLAREAKEATNGQEAISQSEPVRQEAAAAREEGGDAPSETGPIDPARDTVRADAARASTKMGTTRAAWFKRGADVALGLEPEPDTTLGKTTSRAYEQGRKFASDQMAQRASPTNPAEPSPSPETGGVEGKTSAPTSSRTRSTYAAAVERALDNKQITARDAQMLQIGMEDAKVSDLYDSLDTAIAENEASKNEGKAFTAKLRKKPEMSETDKAIKNMETLEKNLRQRLDKLGLKDIALEVVPQVLLYIEHGVKAAGDFKGNLIRVAFEPPDSSTTLDHEAIHALKELGLFTPAEWMTLSNAVQGTDLMEWADNVYQGLDKASRTEEAIAEGFARWREDRNAAPRLTKFFRRIQQFFDALKGAFKKSGYTTAKEIFEAIDRGDFGKRGRYKGDPPDGGGNDGPSGSSSRLRKSAPASEGTPAQAVKDIGTNLKETSKDALAWAAFTEDVANLAPKEMRETAQRFVKLQRSSQALGRRYSERVADIKRAYEKLPDAMRTETGPLNKYLFDSTSERKWGYTPTHAPNVKVDPEMKRRFDKLPADAQAVVKSVFRHGYDSLMEMRESVTDAISSNYDALIAEADAAGESTKQLETKKASALERYKRLTDASEELPYAPKKRDGNYVVVGMSEDMQEAKASKDTARIEELEGNPDHYYVDFVDTKAQAERLSQKLKSKYAATQNFRKETAAEQLGGAESFLALERLQKLVDNETSGKASTKAEAQAQRDLRRLAADLYLATLAETSARKAELSRANVMSGDIDKGGSLDMMRAFVTRGRATAHFIAQLHSNSKLLDALAELKEQANDPKADNRDARERTYNELATRYANSAANRHSRVMDAIVATTSTMLLTLNPAYHIQNFMQPAMLSVPQMAGKHGYLKTQGEFVKAYRDVGKMMGDATVTERPNLNKLPDDVKDAIKDLEARGVIDTGIATELGNWEADGNGPLVKNWNVAARILRHLPQNMETMNRVVTGMAAYRAEMAKHGDKAKALDYAEKLIIDTHGDYAGYNAPRPMSGSGLTRTLVQFKKFPIILTTMMVKQIKNSLKGASAEERAVARKALMFTLGHAGVVGGAIGLPGAAMIGGLVNAAFNAMGDEEPDDPQLIIERALGGKSPLSDLLSKGVPYAFMNLDTSGKLGMGQMLNIAPFQDTGKLGEGRQGALELVGQLTGPFFGGLVPRWAQAYKDAQDGHLYKGIEGLIPNGPSNLLKAYRFKNEGVTNRRGEVLIDPSEISYADAFATAIGFQTQKLADQSRASSLTYTTDTKFKDRAASIKADYRRAKEAGKPTDKAIAEWKDLQAAQEKNNYKPSPLSELLKSGRRTKQNTRQTAGGVQYNRRNRGFVEELAADPE